MDAPLLDFSIPGELERDDFAQFLAEFADDPTFDIQDSMIPAPDIAFDPDGNDCIQQAAQSSAGAVSNSRSHAPPQQCAAAPQNGVHSVDGKVVDEKLEKLRAKNRRGQARYRERCKARGISPPGLRCTRWYL